MTKGVVLACAHLALLGAAPERSARRRALELGKDPGSPTAETEEAVDRALSWLASCQEPDGHWNGERKFAPDDPGRNTDPGVTALALMAFLAAGDTEFTGVYSETVLRAVSWLMKIQGRNGAIGDRYEGALGYHHGMAGLALAEAYAGSKSLLTKRAAQRAVDYSVRVHRSPSGGWRYKPRQNGDVSVTAWFVQQLVAARNAGLRVDAGALAGAAAFLGKCTRPDGTFGYLPGRQTGTAVTAAGLLCTRSLRGRTAAALARGAASHVMRNLPTWGGATNFYYWYYGTLAMHRTGGGSWQTWWRALCRALLPNQRTGDASVDGSWDPVGQWCGQGGRVYATAMAALCLAAPYRHAAAGK